LVVAELGRNCDECSLKARIRSLAESVSATVCDY
jgi:hypothetical protein